MGGPVTLTHPDVTRYFMTIQEATQLVLRAGAMGQGGEVFLLDMGERVRIADLARRMIAAAGYTVRDADNPSGDIEIAVTDLRPGEKLEEQVLITQCRRPTRASQDIRGRGAWPVPGPDCRSAGAVAQSSRQGRHRNGPQGSDALDRP